MSCIGHGIKGGLGRTFWRLQSSPMVLLVL